MLLGWHLSVWRHLSWGEHQFPALILVLRAAGSTSRPATQAL